MDIRKISIGPDYKSGAMHYIVGQPVLNGKSGAMHYIVGQPVLNGNYHIHLIKYIEEKDSILIYIQNEDEIMVWKEFTSSMPVSIEYNINFL